MKEASDWVRDICEVCRPDSLDCICRDIRILVEALYDIADYNIGEAVTASCDDPASASKAREALEKAAAPRGRHK